MDHISFRIVEIKSDVCSTAVDALTEVGSFMRTEVLCVSAQRVASGPRVKLASCKSALTPPLPTHPHTHTHTYPVVYSTGRSKAVSRC